ncbi:MAG TPA: terminase gpA endonuclease subunit [Polyangiaceae bacterium]|nr:terminase gpA endonuclease subunit [Polyangiaceae bacterium]
MARRSSAATAAKLPFPDEYETAEQREWLAQEVEGWTHHVEVISPSEWAERNRYLPASATPFPGPFSFDVAPYSREILDCMSVESPVREVTWMKGVQLCATTAVLENTVGYYIAVVQTESMMLLTADAELAKTRLEQYIMPMIQLSGLDGLIKSSDEKNPRKTGKTDRKIEWYGGGFLVPYGAVNAAKLRSLPMRALLRDEVDAYKRRVGNDGDPMALSESRTRGFEASRKILNISTPLFKGQSNIEDRYLQGDQRKYLVHCLKCNFPQELRWRHDPHPQTGEINGIVWQLDEKTGMLLPDSVRYLCQECGHPHTNENKQQLLSPDHGAHWKPTAVPVDPNHRSYHLSALYSPVGMQTWAACVRTYLEGWDVERNRLKDANKFQVFYNNVLGWPWEQKGEKVRFDAVSTHRRSDYHFGQVSNAFATKISGGPILLLTCTVDVQKTNLAVTVFGWCKDHRAILVDYWRFEGNTELLDDPGTWKRLDKLITGPGYTADDGKKYRIAATLIDSGYLTDQVYAYCATFRGGVFPVKGRPAPPKAATIREFSDFKTPNGLVGFTITVDFYKDRWSAALRREWDGIGMQPMWFFNAPIDVTDAQLKELTVESKHPRKQEKSGQEPGFEWRRIPGAPNELWDLLGYANAALDLLAWNYCRGVGKLEFVNWVLFYDHCLQRKLFFA